MIPSALKIFVKQIEPEMELGSKRNEYSEIIKFRGAISKSCIKPFRWSSEKNFVLM